MPGAQLGCSSKANYPQTYAIINNNTHNLANYTYIAYAWTLPIIRSHCRPLPVLPAEGMYGVQLGRTKTEPLQYIYIWATLV